MMIDSRRRGKDHGLRETDVVCVQRIFKVMRTCGYLQRTGAAVHALLSLTENEELSRVARPFGSGRRIAPASFLPKLDSRES